jgi:hypothetical protein
MNINQHLNHQQICDLLLSGTSETASATPAQQSQELHREHLHSCLICSSELELLRSSVTGFRALSIVVADRALARRPLTASSAPLDARRGVRFISPAFFWAATSLVFAVVLPLSLYRSHLNPFLKHGQTPVVVSTTPAAIHTVASSALSDEALLESINQDLSASVPSPMQPLAGFQSDTAAAQTTSSQRKN